MKWCCSETKRRMHARIADQLKRYTDSNAMASPQIMAHHYEHSEQKQLAIEFLLRASERSLALSASEEALRLLHRGLNFTTCYCRGRHTRYSKRCLR